jgi:DNA-binding CsgD family transcriptional regulator
VTDGHTPPVPFRVTLSRERLSLRTEPAVAIPDLEMLAIVVSKFLKATRLPLAERREVMHIARGLASKESARIEGVPVEVIRTRRKLIYRKLRLSGAGELVSRLLGVSLAMLSRSDGE